MLLYKAAVFLLRIWAAIGGCRFIGRENIPAGQSLLVIANHTSFADPLLLACALPQHITFIAKEGFYRRPFTRRLFGAVGVVFLNKGESDLTALRTSLNQLKQGHTVAIFPEGHRNRDQVMSEFLPGAGYLALKAGVPVLPLAIHNSKDIFRFWKRNIVVNIGAPIDVEQPAKVDQQYTALLSRQFYDKVAALHEENINLTKNTKHKQE